jgi:hypothetical protein
VTTAVLLLAAGTCLAQADADRIALQLVLRDDDVQRVAAPAVRLELSPAQLVPLADDGAAPDERAGDRVWSAATELRRVQRLELTVLDTATSLSLGTLAVQLPAAGEATLALRTQAGEPAVVLEDDGSPDAAASAAGPAGQAAALASGAGDRFAYALWVLLLIGLLGFGYLRLVVRRLYLDDFLPTWRKLDRWLDRELQK